MRRIGTMGLAAMVIVAGVLPAAAAPPTTHDVIVLTVDGSDGALTATAAAVDGFGTVTLEGSAEVWVECFGAAMLQTVAWDVTLETVFDLHPNGSSGTATVEGATIQTEDCSGTSVTDTVSFTATFDTDPRADRWRDESGNRVVSRTGTGTLSFDVFQGVAVTVEAERTYLR